MHPNYKERVIKARDIDSEVTGMSTGHPIRVLRNQMSREYLKMEKEGASFEELEQLTLGSLRKAVIDGDVVHGSLMAGQSAGLVKKEQSCREIIEEIMTEADATVKPQPGVSFHRRAHITRERKTTWERLHLCFRDREHST